MQERVAMVRQRSYEPDSLRRAIKRAIILTGFDLESVAGQSVLLKPNMLGAYPPSMGVTTHPQFVAAAGTVFKEAGAEVSVGDSPNGVNVPKRVWELTGIEAACREAGLTVAGFEAAGGREIDGRRISNAALDADLIVNLPKFKTHGLTILTLAVKNMFGCVNGMQKSGVHRAFPDNRSFSREMVKIAEVVRPALSIIDGITAMEGDGPSAGILRDLGLIVVGQDMHRVDEACCNAIGFDPGELETLDEARAFGYWEPGGIELVGDEVKRIDFLLPTTYTTNRRDWWISGVAIRLIFGNLGAQPKIDRSRCKRCGMCVDACPVDAIEGRGEDLAPRIKKDLCIQCFCCHEICPHRAIDLRPSASLRIWRWLTNRRSARAVRENGEAR